MAAKLKKIDYDGDGVIYEIEQNKRYKLVLSMGKDPKTGRYPRRVETFSGTLKQAIKRLEGMHGERDLLKEIADLGISSEELVHYGLTDKVIFSRWRSAREVEAELFRRKAEEQKAIAKRKSEEEAKAEAERHKITYAEVSDKMLSEIEQHGRNRKSGEPLTNRTKTDYRLSERYVISCGLGSKPIDEITEDDVLMVVESLRAAGKGETTVHKCFSMIRRVLEYSRKRLRLISFNPVDSIEDTLKPVRPTSERQGIPEAEWLRMIRLVLETEPEAHRCAVLIAACNGLRIGECLGLIWDNVELDAPIPHLHIRQQYTECDGIHATKTKNGHKTPLDTLTVDYLRRWRALQAAQLNELGIEQGKTTPVCSNAVGGVIGTSNFETWWRRWCVDNGFGIWVDDDGKRIAELTIGFDAPELYDDCTIEWRDVEGWPCDELGRRFSRSHKRPQPKPKRHYVGVTPHMLRHTFFTLRSADMENPVSDKELQYLGGWTTPRMVREVYTHSDEGRALASGGFTDRMVSTRNITSNACTA